MAASSSVWPFLWIVLFTPCVVLLSLLLVVLVLRFLFVPLLNLDLFDESLEMKHSVYCRLCHSMIPTKKWSAHRVDCAKDHSNALESWPRGLKTCVLDGCLISHRCQRCGAILRRLPVVDKSEVNDFSCCGLMTNKAMMARDANMFRCDNMAMCPSANVDKMGVDGNNCVVCYRCDFTLCHVCARNNFCLGRAERRPEKCELALIDSVDVARLPHFNELSVYEVINCSQMTSPAHPCVQNTKSMQQQQQRCHQPLLLQHQLRQTRMATPSPPMQPTVWPIYSTYV